MKLHQRDEHSYEFVHNNWKISAGLIFGCLYFSYHLLHNVTFGSPVRNAVLGPVIGIVFTAIGAAVYYEKCLFHFDLVDRVVSWQRSRLFGKEVGEVSFDAIRNIRLEAAKGSSSSRRIVIETDEFNLPITRVFKGQKNDVQQQLADQLLTLVHGHIDKGR